MGSMNSGAIIRPVRGDKDSPVHELMGVAPSRKEAIETLITYQCGSEPPKSNMDMLSSIKEAIQNTREFAYAMFYWGFLQNIPPARSAEDEDEIDIDNPLIM